MKSLLKFLPTMKDSVEIGAGSLDHKDPDFDIYTRSVGFLFPAGFDLLSL